MTYDILRSTNKIGFIKTAYLYKGVIAVRNDSSSICR